MSFRVRVKICGITQLGDALAAINAGADALGFVFYDASSRHINTDKAAGIIKEIPPFVNKVALFVNPSYEYVCKVLESTSIDVLQFHGDEGEAFCNSFNRPYMKAIRIQKDSNLDEIAASYHSACGLLVDTFDSHQYGGTGKTFNWALLPNKCSLPLILAGGLTTDNVHEAISSTAVYAVDVSSGVEKTKGVKDHALIQQFMREVKRANQ
jgi:phosphoribosylanthranilate isomerase